MLAVEMSVILRCLILSMYSSCAINIAFYVGAVAAFGRTFAMGRPARGLQGLFGLHRIGDIKPKRLFLSLRRTIDLGHRQFRLIIPWRRGSAWHTVHAMIGGRSI